MRDKVAHLIAGALIAAAVGLAFGAARGLLAAMLAGAAKEAWDARHGGTVEGLDWAMTTLGGCAAAVVVAMLK